jgi:hypothetical protein
MIDKEYGKKESIISLSLMCIVVVFIISVVYFYLAIYYGDSIINNIRSFITRGNFFDIFLTVLSIITITIYGVMLYFSIKGISKSTVGINHQVNTKDSLTYNIISLSVASIFVFLFIVLVILNYILKTYI